MKTLSPLTKLILSWLCFLLLLSCSGNDALRVNLGMSGSVSVFGLDGLEAKPGEEVVVKGQNLSAKVLIEVESKSTELRVLDSSSASFVVPTDAAKGLLTVTFIKGGRTLAKLPLMNSEAIEGLSAASVP